MYSPLMEAIATGVIETEADAVAWCLMDELDFELLTQTYDSEFVHLFPR